MTRTLRTFVALPLAPDITARLADIQRTLKRACPDRSIRWVEPERVHITLAFLGDIIPARVDPTHAALQAIARNAPPLTVQVAHLGAFPHLDKPRVLWLGIEDHSGGLNVLHQAVNEALSQVGYSPETRPFHPHLTLGRTRRHTPRADVQRIAGALRTTEVGVVGRMAIQRLIFFQSHLTPHGAQYTPLHTYTLTAP